MSRRTHLYEYHVKHARMTEFAGFEMPLWYEGITQEHLAVRNSVGIFDVTHMGRSIVKGRDAVDFLNYILPRDIPATQLFQGRYTVFLNEHGGIKDDLTLFRLSEDEFLLVYNAANREKDYNWMIQNSKGFNVEIIDISDRTPMYAVQGPKAVNALNKITDVDISKVRRYWATWAEIDRMKVLLTRTGYTGEDGFEVYLWDTPLDRADKALKLWNMILEAGSEYGIKPCGLGARDTLRLEAGMCLYDHDINEEINPFEARLDFTVNLNKGVDFIGRKALERIKEEGIKRIRVGVKLIERGIPRAGYKIYSKLREEIGFLTSGTYSPLLRCGIGMGYVKTEYSNVGEEVYIDIRGKLVKGVICNMPFYDITKYGWKRKTLKSTD